MTRDEFESIALANERLLGVKVLAIMCILAVLLVVAIYNVSGPSARYLALLGILAENSLVGLVVVRSTRRRKAQIESLQAELVSLRTMRQKLIEMRHAGVDPK